MVVNPLSEWMPEPGWHDTVDDAVEILQTLVTHELGEGWTLAVLGSVRQGLALRGSDLDLCVHRSVWPKSI